MMCEDTSAEWGTICATCGVRLPPLPDKLTSWQASRATDPLQADRARQALGSGVYRERRMRFGQRRVRAA